LHGHPSFTSRVNSCDTSSFPFRPQRQAPFRHRNGKSLTDSGTRQIVRVQVEP
jgi:hypothetical protein